MKKTEIFAHLEGRRDAWANKADDSYVRVMTSNVLLTIEPKSKFFELNYEERADILAETYLYYRPDSIGLQEVGRDMECALKERLSEVYSFADTPLGDHVNWCYHGIPLIQNFTPVIYNKLRYEAVDGRYHLFHGGTGQVWSYHWLMLRSLQDPEKKYIHMNLHYSCGGVDEQRPGVEDVHNELVHLRRLYPTTPIFVTGDYNFERAHELFALMVEGLQMDSGAFLAEDAEERATHYLCHDLGSPELQMAGIPEAAIDHITVTTDLVEVKLHRALLDELLCKSSDHSSRILDIAWKSKTD